MPEPAEPGVFAGRSGGVEIIGLAREELEVSRRQRETCVVRVKVETRLCEERVDMLLTHRRAEVSRVPIGEYVDVMPDVREEGDFTIIPVVEEVLVLERRLLLREEIHVRKVETTERHVETVALRRQEAVVTRHASGEDPQETRIGSENEHE